MSDIISLNPLKTLSVSGKLSSNIFIENVCQRNNDISVGNWTISLAEVTLKYPKDFTLSTTLLFDITCNLVQSYSFNESKTVSLKSESLVKFFVNSTPTINVSYLPQRWFIINNPTDTLTITLKHWPSKPTLTEDDKKLLAKTHICFTLLLKRIN